MKKKSGSCQCGNLKYEIDGENLGLGICYCTECQKLSSGIATYSLVIKRSSFKLLSGTLKQWERSSDNGNRNIGNFCPECGNRIYHENPETPDIIRVKAGKLEDGSKLEPDMHIWLRSAPSWVKVPEGAMAYQTQPSVEKIVKYINELRAKKQS
ncbi:MAG: GFA family protein [Moorea sp. SIO2B7]|nr:GFA family protein [Moorena sp. SIO2B7]